MNKNDLLDKFSDVDPKLITDAYKKPRKRHGIFIGITGAATVAAAAAIAVAVGTHIPERPHDIFSTYPGTDSTIISTDSASIGTDHTSSIDSTSSAVTPPVETDPYAEYAALPVISVNDYGKGAAGGGSSGIGLSKSTRYLTSSGLACHSPWSENAELKTLPVYKSDSSEPDTEKMREYLQSFAAALGIDESELEITDNSSDYEGQYESYRKLLEEQNVPEDEIERELERIRRSSMSMAYVHGTSDGVRLSLYTNYLTSVYFDEPIEFPDGCSLDGSDSEKLAAMNYFVEKYNGLFGWECPIIEISDETNRVYDASGDIETQIVNYRLKYADFSGGAEDRTYILHSYSMENCQKLGDYPILTARQAEDILRSDSTPEAYRLPADAQIVKTDIVYTNGVGMTAVMPYYEFYVKSDEVSFDGYDVTCDVYRIPAVPERFINFEAKEYGARA